MWECGLGDEPVDAKLLWLRFFGKIGFFFAGIAAGALLVGGGYFLKKEVFAPRPEYQTVGEIYLDYVIPEGYYLDSVYFGPAAWNDLVHTDEIVESVRDRLGEQGIEVTAQTVRDSVEADLPYDSRIVVNTVTTAEPELSVAMGQALEQAVVDFCAEQKEFALTRVLTSPEQARRVVWDVRTFHAVVLGAFLGGFLILLGMLLYVTLDDSVYLPSSLEKRYGLPALGTLEDKELTGNLTKLLKGCRQVALTGRGAEEAAGELAKKLEAGAETWKAENGEDPPVLFAAGEIPEDPEELKKLRQADGVIFVAAFGGHDGKRMEKELAFLKRQEIPVRGGLLWNADEKLLKRYYGIGLGKRARHES